MGLPTSGKRSNNKRCINYSQVSLFKDRSNGHVITSQHKAWDDTIRMMMYVDLILNSIKVRDTELILLMNNWGPHKTTESSDFFTKHKINTCPSNSRPLRIKTSYENATSNQNS